MLNRENLLLHFSFDDDLLSSYIIMIYIQCLPLSNFGNGSKMWLTATKAGITTLSDCYLPGFVFYKSNSLALNLT